MFEYLRLMRFDKPIGIFLLLWPVLWALWLATAGHPDIYIVLIFIFGTMVMRAAGCVINDIADRNFDKFVYRTQARPLTAGKITLTGAWICFALLIIIAFLLVLQLNLYSIYLACGAVFFAALYPFTKRWLQVPQVFLGFAFSFGILMAFAATTNHLTNLAWWLFGLNIIWVISYDTMYAMVDRADDYKIGIKSTAILFGNYDKLIIAILQIGFLAGFIYIAIWQQLSWIFYLALVWVFGLICYQQFLLRQREPAACFKAFLNNNCLGMVIFLGLLIHYCVV